MNLGIIIGKPQSSFIHSTKNVLSTSKVSVTVLGVGNTDWIQRGKNLCLLSSMLDGDKCYRKKITQGKGIQWAEKEGAKL